MAPFTAACAALERRGECGYLECMANPQRTMTDAQKAYEAKRAAKAGMSLEKWLASKQRIQEQAAKEREKAKAAEAAAKMPKKAGFFSRLIERAHKPF
jgi:hypothetical protein